MRLRRRIHEHIARAHADRLRPREAAAARVQLDRAKLIDAELIHAERDRVGGELDRRGVERRDYTRRSDVRAMLEQDVAKR